jgi:hypothetical protein
MTMTEQRDARRRHNPWFVLGLERSASRLEIERTGQKLLGLLALRERPESYATPYGPAERDEALVRWAVNELREPKRRVLHELWAELGPERQLCERGAELDPLIALGWGGQWSR